MHNPSNAALPAPARAPLRILYVEDNPIVREVTAELLAQDHEIVAVATAEEAMQEFTTRSFDAVITDVSLPEMSGLDLARRILHINPTLPIIIASGYALTDRLAGLGPRVRSLIKPFDSATIDALIADLCQANESYRGMRT